MTDGLTTAVLWGDGATSSRNPNDPIDSTRPNPQVDPPGTASFKHVYAAPANGSGFTVAITAQFAGESQTVAVGVTPRYRVTQYTALFSPLNHCDSLAEDYTECTISRAVQNLVPEQTFEFERQTQAGVGIGYPLPEFKPFEASQFSLELTAADTPSVGYYDIYEIDPVFDQGLTSVSIPLNPLLGSRSVWKVTQEGFTSPLIPDEICRAEIRADIDVKLLTPGLGGPVLSQ